MSGYAHMSDRDLGRLIDQAIAGITGEVPDVISVKTTLLQEIATRLDPEGPSLLARLAAEMVLATPRGTR